MRETEEHGISINQNTWSELSHYQKLSGDKTNHLLLISTMISLHSSAIKASLYGSFPSSLRSTLSVSFSAGSLIRLPSVGKRNLSVVVSSGRDSSMSSNNVSRGSSSKVRPFVYFLYGVYTLDWFRSWKIWKLCSCQLLMFWFFGMWVQLICLLKLITCHYHLIVSSLVFYTWPGCCWIFLQECLRADGNCLPKSKPDA